MSDRPKVGPADPETRKKALRAELDRAAGGNSANKKPPTVASAPKKRRTPVPERVKRPTERRYGPQGDDVMEIVDKAVSGAKPDRY